MIAPTLLIGLGGAGSKIVRRVSKMVREEQRSHLAFVIFDTDINELRENRKTPFVKSIQISTNLTVGEYLSIDMHARDTWFPVNAILNSKTLTDGAGQVRAVSRLAFDSALRAGKLEPLHEAIQDLYRLEEGEEEQALRVIIVSSLAGGTGSGLFLPVALYIKNYLAMRFRQNANITRGFFLLPEVFDEVIPGQVERKNLQSNAYAALRELDAFLMKGDATLAERYRDTVRIEFPRTASDDYDEYLIRPYDFCFLFDAQNAEGRKLNSHDQYLDHAANCIYAQSIGPMNSRSNSSEDNVIRLLCEERGRNRYAGAGSSMLVYPVEDVKEYLSLQWAKECVSNQWLIFDDQYKEMRQRNRKMREAGIHEKEQDLASSYIAAVKRRAEDRDPFAEAIKKACMKFDAEGVREESDKWTEYVRALISQVTSDALSGQKHLDVLKEQIGNSVEGLEGGRDAWDDITRVYKELDTYKRMIKKHNDNTARTIAYLMFYGETGNSVTSVRLPHRLETYLRDMEGNFIHPNAVRYFLYHAVKHLKDAKSSTEKKIKNTEQYFDVFQEIYLTKNDERIEDLADRSVPLINKVTNTLDDNQKRAQMGLREYLSKANGYRADLALVSVLEEGIAYINGLCEAFRKFFGSFESRVSTIEKRIGELSVKYENTQGKTARHVCASGKCLKKMAQQHPYMGSAYTIDSQLAEEIYNKVRRYSMMTSQPQNDSYFQEIFEQGILGYFKAALMQQYGSEIDMDIISALEREAEYEEEEHNSAKVEQYVIDAIKSTRDLSCPFIERPLGERKQPVHACAYNPHLDPHDGGRHARIVDQELKNFRGVADEEIRKNMILFYQSFYGLRANELSKFAPPEKTMTSTRDGGEYYKAYFELIQKIHPQPHRSKAITPHIDRWWHAVTMLPDLDEGNQEAQEYRLYAAFFWGMMCDFVEWRDVGAGKMAYYLESINLGMDRDMEDGADLLTVSNNTPCDKLYEVLDALSIYPKLMERIMDKVEDKIVQEVDHPMSLEKGILHKGLNNFELKQYPLKGARSTRSIFDLPVLMKKSIKAEVYSETIVLRMLKAQISEIKRYLLYFCKPEELPDRMRAILLEQFDRFLEDMEQERAEGNRIYQDRLFGSVCHTVENALEELGFREDAQNVIDQKKAKEKLGQPDGKDA